MHKYGSVVLLVRGDAVANALVVQSIMQGEEEHLTVVSLDPTKESPLLSGMNVDAAIRRDFVTPLKGGKTYGWRDVAEKEVLASGNAQIKEVPPVLNAAEQMDEAQGEIEPGDPDSPHAINTEAAQAAPADPTPGPSQAPTTGSTGPANSSTTSTEIAITTSQPSPDSP